MVSLVRGGVLDFIGAARPSIADSFMPKKIEEGRIEEIRECIGCNIRVPAPSPGWYKPSMPPRSCSIPRACPRIRWRRRSKSGVPRGAMRAWSRFLALDILGVTFAMNIGWAKTRKGCADLVVYQPNGLIEILSTIRRSSGRNFLKVQAACFDPEKSHRASRGGFARPSQLNVPVSGRRVDGQSCGVPGWSFSSNRPDLPTLSGILTP